MPLADVLGFALGELHSIILKQDGSVWSTGITSVGLELLLGLRTPFTKVIPSRAIDVSSVRALDTVWY